jgi:4-carboxymuconolactone decarboxylase
MTSYPLLESTDLTPRQREVFAAMPTDQPEALADFYGRLAHSPELAERMQQLMSHLRSGLRLPEPLRALAVLVAAAKHSAADTGFFLTLPDIRDALLPEEISEALARGLTPANMNRDQAIVYDFCCQIRSNGRVNNATFEQAAARFGREVCLEITILTGVVVCISMLANVIRM